MNLLKKSEKRFPLFLIVAQPPFPVFFEVVCSGAPLLSVTILGTVVVELPVKLEWKHTAVATRIPAMCVDSTVALLWKKEISVYCELWVVTIYTNHTNGKFNRNVYWFSFCKWKLDTIINRKVLLCESKNREHFDLILTLAIVQQPVRSDMKPQNSGSEHAHHRLIIKHLKL